MVSLGQHVNLSLGIRRDERGEVVCASQITERQTPKGKLIEAHEQIQRYHRTFRDEVEAKISFAASQFVEERSGALSELRRRVRASRPSSHALLWLITS
jgi:hypothetical protein